MHLYRMHATGSRGNDSQATQSNAGNTKRAAAALPMMKSKAITPVIHASLTPECPHIRCSEGLTAKGVEISQMMRLLGHARLLARCQVS